MNPAATASQRCHPVGSRSTSAPRIVAKIGTVNCSVVDSASGSSVTALNRQVMLVSPTTARRTMGAELAGSDRAEPRTERDHRRDQGDPDQLAEEQYLRQARAADFRQLDQRRHGREEHDRQQAKRDGGKDAVGVHQAARSCGRVRRGTSPGLTD